MRETMIPGWLCVHYEWGEMEHTSWHTEADRAVTQLRVGSLLARAHGKADDSNAHEASDDYELCL